MSLAVHLEPFAPMHLQLRLRLKERGFVISNTMQRRNVFLSQGVNNAAAQHHYAMTPKEMQRKKV